MAQQSITIASGTDDGFVTSQNNLWNSTVLLQGINAPFAHFGGLRYSGVSVPQGAIILNAALTLKKWTGAGGGGTAWGNWRGDAIDNAPAWSDTSRPDQIAWTAASCPVQWSGADGSLQVHDVTSIVQEIVNRPGWASGNAIRFGGDTDGADGFAGFYETNIGAYLSPLAIVFSLAAGGSAGRGGGIDSAWVRKTAFRPTSLLIARSAGDARAQAIRNWMFDRRIWRGVHSRAQSYLGPSTDAELYLGERILFE